MNKATSFIDKKGGRGWTRHEEGGGGGMEELGVTQQANGTDNIILVSDSLQPQAHEDINEN